MAVFAGERQWLLSPTELREQLALKRRGTAFLAFQTPDGTDFFVLDPDVAALSIGRDADCDVQLAGDPHVSGIHAELRRLGADWVLIDDGLSRNGTFVNGRRVANRRRLRDGDWLRCGRTQLRFHADGNPRSQTRPDEMAGPPELSPAQRRVLVALCRPYASHHGIGTPASNRAIAEELSLSLEAVKTHLRALFSRFELGDLPQNEKRARLAALAIASQAVTQDELREGDRRSDSSPGRPVAL